MAKPSTRDDKNGARLRAEAARVVSSVVDDGKSLPVAIGMRPMDTGGPRIKAYAYGTLRGFHRFAALRGKLLQRPMNDRDKIVRALILVGIYQLLDEKTPAHAAISATVDATRQLDRPKLASLVNAVLRRFQREKDALLAAIEDTDSARYAHPDWLIKRLRTDWPEQANDILAANDCQPPLWLRVNGQKTETSEYAKRLAKETGGDVSTLPGVDTALRLSPPVGVDRLPGFGDGHVSVQDGGAQLAAVFLDARPGDRVLDACAAPGGKAGHILEREPGIAELTAIDSDKKRLSRVRDNLQRLNSGDATVLCGDVADPASWWDGRPFDRVLLDAPCSATGVIRRHPDIKVLRRASDIGQLADAQDSLLDACWQVLRDGGLLVYVSCSVLRQENDERVSEFLQRNPGARAKNIETSRYPFLIATEHGAQCLPGAADLDGFYYACLVKGA